ncbi:hypothetical protein BS78_K131300 [Paspalum vaginatum]|uniref:Uncharacterized protein n=1 Tax=Paspalum vaginatum TaxID=158149 RepID=A0A9W8CFP5_9POAL|nr:hypothetical protein BS78_K131300 [Paspalum vaginatum]
MFSTAIGSSAISNRRAAAAVAPPLPIARIEGGQAALFEETIRGGGSILPNPDLLQPASATLQATGSFVRRLWLHACMQRQADTAVKSPISHGNKRLQILCLSL